LIGCRHHHVTVPDLLATGEGTRDQVGHRTILFDIAHLQLGDHVPPALHFQVRVGEDAT
jgi:hypothetical protein